MLYCGVSIPTHYLVEAMPNGIGTWNLFHGDWHGTEAVVPASGREVGEAMVYTDFASDDVLDLDGSYL